MADADFTIEGWDEFVERFADLVDKWEAKKEILLKRMGNIYHEELIPNVPVDTSRLVDSIYVGGIEDDTIMVGTNVEYALYVNDGHVQHRRFLPCRSVNGKLVYSKGSKKGIILQEKYVGGKHFFENSMTSANPRLERLVESFMEQIKREVEGSNL